MGYKIADLEERERVILDIYKNFDDNHIEMHATIHKHLSDDKTVILLEYNGDKILNFSSVKIDVFYHLENGVPVIWHNAKIVHCRNYYVLCVTEEGVKTNRRSSYRVSIGALCILNSDKHKHTQTIIKDISLAGFSVMDRKGELELSEGEKANIKFTDLLFEIYLEGNLVRIDKHDNYIIYGFKLTNLCKDLSSYINLKQSRSRQR